MFFGLWLNYVPYFAVCHICETYPEPQMKEDYIVNYLNDVIHILIFLVCGLNQVDPITILKLSRRFNIRIGGRFWIYTLLLSGLSSAHIWILVHAHVFCFVLKICQSLHCQSLHCVFVCLVLLYLTLTNCNEMWQISLALFSHQITLDLWL